MNDKDLIWYNLLPIAAGKIQGEGEGEQKNLHKQMGKGLLGALIRRNSDHSPANHSVQ